MTTYFIREIPVGSLRYKVEPLFGEMGGRLFYGPRWRDCVGRTRVVYRDLDLDTAANICGALNRAVDTNAEDLADVHARIAMRRAEVQSRIAELIGRAA